MVDICSFGIFLPGHLTLGQRRVCSKIKPGPDRDKIEATYAAYRGTLLVKHAEQSNYGQVQKMCPHCGLMEDQIPYVNFRKHIAVCELDNKSCHCDISFSNPTEKRRHMKVAHSGKKYFNCSQCGVITSTEQGLQNHIAFNHGFSGMEMACDLCLKPFKTPNHLRVHRLNHESYFCPLCNIEILGRNTHKSHVLKVHGTS